MTIEIYSGGTWVNITPYIAYQGITFSRNDVEAPDAGRTLDGIMHRGRVAIKEKIEIKTKPLTRAQTALIHGLLYPETFEVRVNPYPNTNASKTFTMYANNFKTSYIIHRENGEDIQSMSFPLVEV